MEFIKSGEDVIPTRQKDDSKIMISDLSSMTQTIKNISADKVSTTLPM